MNYIFQGEKHNFWEFLYVDKGEAEVLTDKAGYKLRQGDIIFHKPNEFHSVWANQKVAPNLIVISFECKSTAMSFFQSKIFSLNTEQRELLAQTVKTGFLAFSSPLDEPNLNTLINRSDYVAFGLCQINPGKIAVNSLESAAKCFSSPIQNNTKLVFT